MPIPLTNPGVYILELPPSVQPIVGVSTSVTAFHGPAPQGKVDEPVRVNSWADYENEFGSLDSDYPLSYAVYLFFQNGGTTGLVVRYNDPNVPTASAALSADITLEASSPGEWGTNLVAVVDTDNLLDPTVNKFNLTIKLMQGQTTVVAQEAYPGVSLIKGSPQYLPPQLVSSQLVVPAKTNQWAQEPGACPVSFTAPAAAGAPVTSAPVPLGNEDLKTGIYALLKADIFNILCLPVDPTNTYRAQALEDAATFCVKQRAMLIVDPPFDKNWAAIPLLFSTITTQPQDFFLTPNENAAVYYPNLVLTDSTGAKFDAGPCGAMAGVWAATDSTRGVWKAPAGTATAIIGIAA